MLAAPLKKKEKAFYPFLIVNNFVKFCIPD